MNGFDSKPKVRQIVRTDELEREATLRQRGKVQGCTAANPSLSALREKVRSWLMRLAALVAAENQYCDQLIDFMGSGYPGFQLMPDNHLLPVILPRQIRLKPGGRGLTVTDLRAAPFPIATILTVNNVVSESIKRHMQVGVNNMQFNPEQFDQIFHNYLSKV